MIGIDYKTDAAFSNLGDLPTGFFVYPEKKPIFIRPFTLAELQLIHRGRATRRLEHIVRAVDLVNNIDTLELTDGDFEFMCAWLRVQSFPEVPLLVRWTCTKENLVHKDNKAFYTGPERTELQLKVAGYNKEPCMNENVEIVHSHSTTITSLEDDFEQKGFETHLDVDFPRVSTLIEYYELIDEDPSMKDVAKYARWLKAGSNLKEKLEAFYSLKASDFNELRRVSETYAHGVKETVNLRCGLCSNSLSHTSTVDHLTFFADNSQTAIMDMQFKLMSVFGLNAGDSTPSKSFLYHYSSLLKEEQEEAQRRSFKPPR